MSPVIEGHGRFFPSARGAKQLPYGRRFLARKGMPSAMELVPNDFSKQMQREVETFVQRFKSIPAFTANLTMELFNRQTQC